MKMIAFSINARAMPLLMCVVAAATVLLAGSCRTGGDGTGAGGPSSLSEVPSVRLNFRYEADVPPPPESAKPVVAEERNAAVQANFDQARTMEILDRTISSPDKKRILAVYHRISDVAAEFRLDMYDPDGKLLSKITPDTMAAHFPDTIVWAPDSSTVAFVAMVRTGGEETTPPPGAPDPLSNSSANVELVPVPEADANANTADANAETPAPAAEPTPAPPIGILTFRTEQIYLCDADGGSLKPVTQNEGLIYFYYTWSPDSTMLAALAATSREWQFMQYQADSSGQIFIPVGRLRLVEKNGRERRLDDALTQVRPVWSPDSSKVAAAYDTQIRIYDAAGINPTQAAIPLKNHLLLSAQAFDRSQAATLQAANTDTNANAVNAVPPADPSSATLPDERSLVSYNPIVMLEWPSDDLLYFQTAFVKRMKNETDSVTSFARWHRLALSPQAAANQE